MDITTSNIIITGASSGIGLATAKAAIYEGARVALVARREDRLNTLVAIAIGAIASLTS
ncbi:MAG: SDR family NAD(P)-dependent oxidoreductase [Rhodobacterales bacterium]|uniref:SDR family NAD(P)-dependent oxidoreductase n=1 Tax=Puniceibacterium antarcticum TaxID=1206336 RepID=UPI000C17D70B|nr:SDR family NAD(P)-dependent oxidoreductase [Puniceibacterium antarcticum]